MDLVPPRGAPRLVREIFAYFLRNPAAADSLEGIARWRLLEEGIHRKVMETQRALAWLVKEGFLIEIVGPNTRKLYKLSPEGRDQAVHPLQKDSDKELPKKRRAKGPREADKH